MTVIRSASPNFKSHIIENDYYRVAIKSAQQDLTSGGAYQRGINTLKSLEGINLDGKHDLVEFFQKDGKVYTKINGAVDESRTFPAQKKCGINAQNAIINYAKSNNALTKEPMFDSERKVLAVKAELKKAEDVMCRDLKSRLNRYY